MDDTVSHFITGTCQLFPKVCLTNLHNLILEIALKDSTSPPNLFCIVGSAAEIYIQPVQQNIWDIDVMLYSDENIVVENVTTSLTSKLTGYCDTITCYEMEPYSHLPGYVRLRLTGVLAYNWESNKYTFQKQGVSQFLSSSVGRGPRKESARKLSTDQRPRVAVSDLISVSSEKGTSEHDAIPEFTGVAGVGSINDMNQMDTTQMQNSLLNFVQHRLPMDIVHSIRCPLWPKKEALSWMLRSRPSGWPNRELIEEVVQTGCDVVPGKHYLCEESELLWRISFARAEVVLLRRWTHVQQIVYHMLRYFIKRNSTLRECRQVDSVLNAYHLKTLMLWTCETESPYWWESSSLVVICCKLLSVLCRWLRMGHCPHYFIPNCNLFNYELNSTTRHQVLKTLENFQETSQLSHWFLQHYVLSLHQRLCKSADIRMNLRAVEHTMVLACRLVKKEMLEELEYWIVMVSNAFRLTLSSFGHVGLQRNFNSRKLETESMDCFSEFTQYFMALNLLHLVGFVTCRKGLVNDYKIYEVVADIFSTKSLHSVHGYPMSYVEFLSPDKVYFTKALELMSSLTVQKSSAEFNLLAKLSIECLKASLILQAPGMDENYCSSLGYLASLHDAIGQNDVAARLGAWLEFKISTMNNPYARLNGFFMLYNDDVSNILGFLQLLHRDAKHRIIFDTKIKTMSTFSVALFVKYLRILSGADNAQELLHEAILESGTWSLADHGLYSIIGYRFRQQSNISTAVTAKVKTLVYSRLTPRRFSLSDCYMLTDIELEELMTEIALESLGCFFESVSKTFDVRCNTAVCYRALYLYSRCKYEEVLTLCEKLIQDEFSPLLEMQSPCFAVTTTPPFDKFYDRDIQALLGFGYLFDVCCSKHKSAANIVDLPVFGYSRYKRKLIVLEMHKKTFITGRFIANYLKVRCLLDTNRSFNEIAGAYLELKGRLPFEHIVRYFVLRKLCRYVRTSDDFHQKNQEMKTEIKHAQTAHTDVNAKILIYNQLARI